MAAGGGPRGREDPKGLYATLGVSKDADVSEIRKSYRRLALKWHPDKNPDNPTATSEFQKISASYEVLSDPERRRLYDDTGCVDAEELEEFNGADFAQDIFARFFSMNEDDLDAEEQVLLEEFLRFAGAGAFKRKGRRKKGRGGKVGKGAAAGSRRGKDLEEQLLAEMMGTFDLEQFVPQCPKGHALKKRKADVDYECDICSSDIATGKRVFVCQRRSSDCDYSVCQRCHKQLVEEAEQQAAEEEEIDPEELFEFFCEMSTQTVVEGRRMKSRCEHCGDILMSSQVEEHMKQKHNAEFEAFVEHYAEDCLDGGGEGLDFSFMPSHEDMMMAELLGGSGLLGGPASSRAPRRSKKKR